MVLHLIVQNVDPGTMKTLEAQQEMSLLIKYQLIPLIKI